MPRHWAVGRMGGVPRRLKLGPGLYTGYGEPREGWAGIVRAGGALRALALE